MRAPLPNPHPKHSVTARTQPLGSWYPAEVEALYVSIVVHLLGVDPELGSIPREGLSKGIEREFSLTREDMIPPIKAMKVNADEGKEAILSKMTGPDRRPIAAVPSDSSPRHRNPPPQKPSGEDITPVPSEKPFTT